MLSFTLLTALASTAAAIAIPASPAATRHSTNVTYYQDPPNDGQFCGYIAVSSGNITDATCNQEYTYSLAVQPLHHRDSVFTLYKGDTDCGSDDATSEKYFLPAGGHPVCITTNVLDGGTHTFASGIWETNFR